VVQLLFPDEQDKLVRAKRQGNSILKTLGVVSHSHGSDFGGALKRGREGRMEGRNEGRKEGGREGV